MHPVDLKYAFVLLFAMLAVFFIGLAYNSRRTAKKEAISLDLPEEAGNFNLAATCDELERKALARQITIDG